MIVGVASKKKLGRCWTPCGPAHRQGERCCLERTAALFQYLERAVLSAISYGAEPTHKQSKGRSVSTMRSYHMLPVALLQTPKSRLTDTCTSFHASLTGPHPGIAGPTGGSQVCFEQECNPNLTRAVMLLERSYESDIPRLSNVRRRAKAKTRFLKSVAEKSPLASCSLRESS